MCQMSNSLQKMFRIPAALFARRIVYPVRKFSGISRIDGFCNFLHKFQPLVQIQICQYHGNRRFPQKTTSAAYRKKFRLPLKPQPPVRKQLENLTKKPPTPFSMRLKSAGFNGPYALEQPAPAASRPKWPQPETPKPFTGAKIPVTPKIIVVEEKKPRLRRPLEKPDVIKFEGIEVFNEDKREVESIMTRKLRDFLGGKNLRVDRKLVGKEFQPVGRNYEPTSDAASILGIHEDNEVKPMSPTARRFRHLLKEGGSLKVSRDLNAVKTPKDGNKQEDLVRQIVVDGNIEGSKEFEKKPGAPKKIVVDTNSMKTNVQGEERLESNACKVLSTPASINFDGSTSILAGGGIGGKEGEGGSESSWRILKYSFGMSCLACACAFGYAVKFFGSPKLDGDGLVIEDEFSALPVLRQYFVRALAEINYYNKMIKEPSRDKLLPDPLVAPYYQPPYTLVLEFTDVLVHPEWTYSTGWRFKKRPGLDQFLEALASRFELVVYTAEMGMTVFPIIEALDKNNLISYKLVRDATHFVDGHHVKDLDKLNRDLSKVVVVDWNPDSMKLHGENLFKIDRWDGNDQDTVLSDLTNFLNAISEWEIEDVRKVLTYYSQFEDPLGTFKKRQRELYGEAAV